MGLLITGICAALGIFLSKDKDAVQATEDTEYIKVTEAERLIINTEAKPVGFTVYQTDKLVGYYSLDINFRWEYGGTRPPRKPK